MEEKADRANDNRADELEAKRRRYWSQLWARRALRFAGKHPGLVLALLAGLMGGVAVAGISISTLGRLPPGSIADQANVILVAAGMALFVCILLMVLLSPLIGTIPYFDKKFWGRALGTKERIVGSVLANSGPVSWFLVWMAVSRICFRPGEKVLSPVYEAFGPLVSLVAPLCIAWGCMLAYYCLESWKKRLLAFFLIVVVSVGMVAGTLVWIGVVDFRLADPGKAQWTVLAYFGSLVVSQIGAYWARMGASCKSCNEKRVARGSCFRACLQLVVASARSMLRNLRSNARRKESGLVTKQGSADQPAQRTDQERGGFLLFLAFSSLGAIFVGNVTLFWLKYHDGIWLFFIYWVIVVVIAAFLVWNPRVVYSVGLLLVSGGAVYGAFIGQPFRMFGWSGFRATCELTPVELELMRTEIERALGQLHRKWADMEQARGGSPDEKAVCDISSSDLVAGENGEGSGKDGANSGTDKPKIKEVVGRWVKGLRCTPLLNGNWACEFHVLWGAGRTWLVGSLAEQGTDSPEGVAGKGNEKRQPPRPRPPLLVELYDAPRRCVRLSNTRQFSERVIGNLQAGSTEQGAVKASSSSPVR